MKTAFDGLLRMLEDCVEELWQAGAVLAVALLAGSLVFLAYTVVEREAGAVIAAAIELEQPVARP